MRTFIPKIILISFLLASCTPRERIEVKPTNNLPELTPSKSVSQKATQVKEDFPKGIQNIEPTIALSPVVSTPTSTPDVTFIELPAWVKNPENNLILFTYDDSTGRSSKIGFFNPEDGERAIIKLPYEIYEYFWKDSNHIVFLQGYCDEPPQNITELDISQGTLRSSDTKDFPEAIQSCYSSVDVEQETIKVDASLEEPTVEIVDSSSGEWLRLTDPSDGMSDIAYEVSPNRDYVAIVQIKGKYTFPEMWQPLFGNQVSIYHLPDRKLLATFNDEQKVSSMLLFTDNENLIYVREDTPCVVMILLFSKKCIHNISNRFPDATIILGDSLVNPKKFSFLYFGFSPHQGGFCFYDLFSGEIDCPTNHFDSLRGQTVMNYALSPDNKYLLFEYDYKGCPAPWCDYAGDPQLAVINIDENQLFDLGSSSIYQALDIFRMSSPWRPMP